MTTHHPKKIRMLIDDRGSFDGAHINHYQKGQEYEIGSPVMSDTLARLFVQKKSAEWVELKKEEVAPAVSAPATSAPHESADPSKGPAGPAETKRAATDKKGK